MSSKGKSWTWSEEARARQSEMARKRSATEDMAARARKHGLSRTREYNCWKKMMYRCYKETDPSYQWYGARGIKVCERWHEARNFIEDMGDMPAKCSIERVDVNGDYEPGNCTWIPVRMQAKNRRPWKHTPEGLARIAEARRK